MVHQLRRIGFQPLEETCLSHFGSASGLHLSDNFHVLLHTNLSNCPPSSVRDAGSAAFSSTQQQ